MPVAGRRSPVAGRFIFDLSGAKMHKFFVLSNDDFSTEMPDWIIQKALKLGISPTNKNRFSLIREIQNKEGFTGCYGKSNGKCPNTACCWYGMCKV